MGTNYNPKIVSDSMALRLDIANAKSYPRSGTTWTDLSNNNRNATLVNNPVYDANNSGSLVFNGSNTYCAIANTNGFGVGGIPPVCSLEIWMNITKKSGFQHIAGFRNNTNFMFYVLLGIGSTNERVEARVTTTVATYYLTTVDFTSYYSKWTHAVFVANSTRSDLYLNGTLVGSLTGITGNFGAGSGSGNFRIGITPDGSPLPAIGNISLVSFYTRALSAAEVQQNFNATRGRYNV